MPVAELALYAVIGWSAVGLVGTTLSWRRRERAKARRGAVWIVSVWILYLAILLTVSHSQPQHHVPPGSSECFGRICYSVIATEDLPGFAVRAPSGVVPPERLVRVSVRVLNTAPSGVSSAPRVRALLSDAQGRLWMPVPGLTGVHLTAPLPARHPVVSQPVFRIAADASGLSLLLSQGTWQPGLLIVGNTDSWMHRPTLLELQPHRSQGKK